VLIGLISDEYPVAHIRGGIGAYTKALAALLAGCGQHEVHVFCQNDALEKPSSGEHIHAVSAWNAKHRVARFAYHRALGVIGPVAYKVAWGLAVARAIRSVEHEVGRRFDVLELPEAGGYGVVLRSGGVATPILLRLHACTAILRKYGSNNHRATTTIRLIEHLERLSVARAGLVTSPTRALVRESVNPLRLREEECEIYPNVPPLERTPEAGTAESRQPRTILAVGRIGDLKGTDVVIRAVGRLQKSRYQGLQLLLAGRSEWERPKLDSIIADNLQDGTCTLLGEVSPTEVKAQMRRATILVQASRFENYPTTIIEALQNSCPVVAADVGGIPEIIEHGVSGMLFSPGSVESLADQLSHLLDDSNYAASLARHGKAWIDSELSDAKLLASINGAYLTAIEKQKPRH
jgi:glycosyltransferase involved in cell wall biosynthesis